MSEAPRRTERPRHQASGGLVRRIVRILSAWNRRQGVAHIVFTSRRGLHPGFRTIVDFLTEARNPEAAIWEAVL